MGYDIGGGYDGWRTATPWDGESEISVSFDCGECEFYNEGITIVVGGRSGDADVDCEECGKTNNVDFGE